MRRLPYFLLLLLIPIAPGCCTIDYATDPMGCLCGSHEPVFPWYPFYIWNPPPDRGLFGIPSAKAADQERQRQQQLQEQSRFGLAPLTGPSVTVQHRTNVDAPLSDPEREEPDGWYMEKFKAHEKANASGNLRPGAAHQIIRSRIFFVIRCTRSSGPFGSV
jgi:hypothetical protein